MDRKHSIYKFVYDIFLPNSCPCCKKVLKWDKLICADCERQLPFVNVSVCEKCGQIKCNDHDKTFYDGAFSVMFFKGICKDMIYALKHTGQVNNFAEYSAQKLCEKLDDRKVSEKIDVVTCVPMNIAKRLDRGYNQSKIISDYVSAKLSKNHDYKLLLHKKDSLEQHKLNSRERRTHAEEIFSINPKHSDISGKNVLICDDVLTTGATLNACAKLLKSMGAKEVYCAVISITEFGN